MASEKLTVEQVLGLLRLAPAGSTLVQRRRDCLQAMSVLHKWADGWHAQVIENIGAFMPFPASDEEVASWASDMLSTPASSDFFIITPDLYAQAVMIPGADSGG